jgi:hypothetical protein
VGAGFDGEALFQNQNLGSKPDENSETAFLFLKSCQGARQTEASLNPNRQITGAFALIA